MDLLRERLKARGALCAVLRGGDSESSSDTSSTNTTNNNDKRNAVQNGVGFSGDRNVYSTTDNYSATDQSYRSYVDNSNSSDAVVAIADMGADTIRSSGAAVVDLYRDQAEHNSSAWDKTITTGARVIDKLIDQSTAGFGLAGKAIDSFTPTQNEEQKTMQYGLMAAAALGLGVVLLKGSK